MPRIVGAGLWGGFVVCEALVLLVVDMVRVLLIYVCRVVRNVRLRCIRLDGGLGGDSDGGRSLEWVISMQMG